MKQLKEKLYNKAIEKHEIIFPCREHKDFENCYTHENGKLHFWYNTEDGNTHMLMEKIG